MTSRLPVPAALEAIRGQQGWAVIRQQDSPEVLLVGGDRHTYDDLLDVPLAEGVPEDGACLDRLLVIPFRQVRERGFDAHDDGAPLVGIDLTESHRYDVTDVLAAIPERELDFADRGGFETSDADYEKVVEAIIRDEIGRGEGANLVIGRHYRAVVAGWDADSGPDLALSVFRRLVERERGAYWTFVVFTGDRYLVGASPERHVSVRGGDVRMNPISGTFRLPRDGSDPRPALLDFLRDEKEIYELFMVVDEELKMMCDICHEGGQVLGPFLKPMTHLVHTEYLLAGRSHRDVREILRDTMYAATVTGSPVENACSLIRRYETEGRGYYAAALALLGRDADGSATADSPILIRTADVSMDGRLKVTAGATLVRDSDPAYEVAETHAKAGGILSAFGLAPAPTAPPEDVAALARDEDVLLALSSRNQRLSRFWLTDQAGTEPDPILRNRRVLIVDAEDDFVNMLRHLLGVLGMEVDVLRHEEYDETALAGHDLVVVGPGPGDPRADDVPKMRTMRRLVDTLLAGSTPFLAVCLGHQTLCHRLGLELQFKDIVFQGTQSPVQIGGRTERVGFYNTFVARAGEQVPEGVEVLADPATGDIHLVAGEGFRGIQFHAESILTENGFTVIHDLVVDLIRGREM